MSDLLFYYHYVVCYTFRSQADLTKSEKYASFATALLALIMVRLNLGVGFNGLAIIILLPWITYRLVDLCVLQMWMSASSHMMFVLEVSVSTTKAASDVCAHQDLPWPRMDRHVLVSGNLIYILSGNWVKVYFWRINCVLQYKKMLKL